MNPETDFSIRTFEGGYDKNLSYLVTCSHTGAQLMIDACIDYEKVSNYIKGNLVATLVTHSHNDHIVNLDNYLDNNPRMVVGGYYDSEILLKKSNFRPIHDGQSFKIGKLNFYSLYTPGHFYDSMCYQLKPALFTGDTIFVGRTGRVQSHKSDIEDLYQSVYGKIMDLPMNTRIYPGHNYGNVNSISLEENISISPLLNALDLEDFKKRMMNFEKDKEE